MPNGLNRTGTNRRWLEHWPREFALCATLIDGFIKPVSDGGEELVALMKNRVVSEGGPVRQQNSELSETRSFSSQPEHRAAFRWSQHTPLQFAGIFLGLPQTYSAEERVFISSALDSFGQLAKAVHKAAAEDDVIGDERFS